MLHYRDDLHAPSWTTIGVLAGVFFLFSCESLFWGKGHLGIFRQSYENKKRPLALIFTRNGHHVDQPAAFAAWLGVMLAQYWPGLSASPVTDSTAPRFIPSRLRLDTPTQER